jgi:charged multivesicular body protein 3
MSGIIQSLFGPPKKSPEEQSKEWVKQLRSEGHKLDAQIRKIQAAERKVTLSAKQAAKKDDTVAVRMLAREIIGSRKAVKRLYTAKAQMNSVSMQLQQQQSQLKLTGAMQKSAQIMAQMNQLTHVNEVQQVMQGLSREMTKAGLLEEMMNDTIDSALEDDVDEGELDEEVGKVVEEMMHAKMSGAHVGAGKLPQRQQVAAEEEPAAEDDEEADELMAKFNALRGTA